jgi:hypothetical protein
VVGSILADAVRTAKTRAFGLLDGTLLAGIGS